MYVLPIVLIFSTQLNFGLESSCWFGERQKVISDNLINTDFIIYSIYFLEFISLVQVGFQLYFYFLHFIVTAKQAKQVII